MVLSSKLRCLIILLVLSLPASVGATVSFSVCYDFGCRNSSEVTLSEGQWASVRSLLDAETAADERILIKLAIAQMEHLAGLYTPTYRDIAGNLLAVADGTGGELFPGQLDCVDESINTSRYLQLFQNHGLLRYHQLTERVYRRSILTQHWAVAFRDTGSGEEYVVDSWFADNGGTPILVSRARWQDLSR